MKSIVLLASVFFISCSNENCEEEMFKLLELRTKGWQNCNGSAACIEKIESDYQVGIDKLNCN